jgi:ribosomal RNA-processing protein 17
MESMLQPGIFNHPRPKRSLLPPISSHKKRKTEHKIEEINFDDEKRADYLTGFHKRKVARAKQAQVEAEKMAREERVKFRKQVGLFIIFFFLMGDLVGLGGWANDWVFS